MTLDAISGRYGLRHCATYVAVLLMTAVTSSAQDVIRFCEPANSSANEVTLLDRIQADAKRIAEESGGQLKAEEIERPLAILLTSESIQKRSEAAMALRNIASASRYLVTTILRRVELMESVLPSLEALDDIRALNLTSALVVAVTVDLEAGGREFYGRIVHEHLGQLKQQFPSIYDSLSPVLARHYKSPNLRVTIPETLASYLVQTLQVETEPVNQCILGASVSGCQTTTVSTSADILPSNFEACWKISGAGNTIANTQAVKQPATVCTAGNHCFTLERQMSFRHGFVSMLPGTIHVDANNQTVGVSTKVDRVPLARGIVRRMARKKADRKRSESESIAANQIRNAALPEFNQETDEQFGELNRKLASAIELRSKYLERSPTYQTSSSQSHLFINSTTRSAGNLAGTTLPPSVLSDDLIVVQIHESFVNAVLDLMGGMGEAFVNEKLSHINRKADGESLTLSKLKVLREQLAGPEIAAQLQRAFPTASKDVITVLAEVYPTLAVWGTLQNIAERADAITLSSVLDQLKSRGPGTARKIYEFLTGDTIPKIQFADCDPIRIRFVTNAIELVFHSGPRRKTERVIRLSLDVEAGGIKALPIFSEKDPEIRRLYEVLTQRIRKCLSKAGKADFLTPKHPEDLLELPDNARLSFTEVSLSDGWLTIKLNRAKGNFFSTR